MPHTVNGIGTWYWGKDRIHRRTGTCQFCGRRVELRSYDTTLFVVVVFIPIIPLGRKRVINECSSCSKHRVASLKSWLAAQEKDILAANQAAMQDPRNEEKAASALGVALGYQARDEFSMLAKKFEAMFPQSALVQNTLGDGHAFFAMPSEAEAAYTRSLKVKDDPLVRRALAAILIRNNRPAEAVPHVQHILDQRLGDQVGLISLVVHSLQGQGMHNDAIELLDAASQAFPELLNNKDFKKLRAISEKHRLTGKAVRSKSLKSIGGPRVESGGLLSRLPRLIPVAIVAVLVAVYFGIIIRRGLAHPVTLVNGLERPYMVKINDAEYSLAAHGRRDITVAEGDVTVQIADPKLTCPPVTVHVASPFFARPFDHSIDVINPDGTAMLFREEASYSESGQAGDEPRARIFAGDFHHHSPGVDYAFVPFPHSLKLPSKSAVVLKSRLEVVDQLSSAQLVEVLLEHNEKMAALNVIRHRLVVAPDDLPIAWAAVGMLPPEEAEALFRTRLGDRPVLIDWHRAYQELMERTHPGVVEAEYTRMLAAEPDNADLTYLLGRVTDNRERAHQLFEKATNAPKPVAYGFHAMAYEALTCGEYEKALDLERRALAINPGNVSFLQYELTSLEALGRWDGALAQVRRRKLGEKTEQGFTTEEIYLLHRKGDVAGAKSTASHLYDSLKSKSSEQALINLRLAHDGLFAYLQGDEAGYAKAEGQMSDANHFLTALLAHQYSDAAQAIGDPQSSAAGDAWLLIYVAATESGDATAANQAIERAAALLAKGDKPQRQASKWLGSASAPPVDAAVNLSMSPETKRVLLVALGLRYSEIRQPCFAMARKLNFDRRFPYLMIERMTKG